MKTSAAMDEIRKIRDENSLRHLSQTREEREAELQKSMEWYAAAIGKPLADLNPVQMHGLPCREARDF